VEPFESIGYVAEAVMAQRGSLAERMEAWPGSHSQPKERKTRKTIFNV